MLVDISFPPPTPYEGDERQERPPSTAYLAVDEPLVGRAFRGASSKRSPGPDVIGPLAIRCVYDWEPDRAVALIRAHIRLDTHPDKWKTARGVTIPKPGKDDYNQAKSYRCISLFNCLGKIVEKVAVMMVSAHYETAGGFHPGQYGCRMGRSAVDAVGVTITRTQEAWSRGCITGALLMDVAAAFPSVARGCLLRKMRNAGLDECWCYTQPTPWIPALLRFSPGKKWQRLPGTGVQRIRSDRENINKL